MKQTIRTILISSLAGWAGALVFQVTNPFPNDSLLPRFTAQDSQQAIAPAPAANFATYRTNTPTENADFVNAAALSTPCVVYIKTVAAGQERNYTWFDMFFNGEGRSNQVAGSGSGVIFSKDGYIVTNNHVIAGATDIEVIHNKRSYKAKLIGTDPSTDLALVKVEANNLPTIKLAHSNTLNVGDWVLAVGNPFNLTSTVTAGIVSAKGRNINILESQFPIESFIQTDAAINPGNSGGALVNTRGELIGINTAILSQTGSYTGYGFAVPSDIVAKVVNDLKEFGQVQKAFLGADVIDVNEEVYKELSLDDFSGVVITYLEKEGAAESAGLQRGDVILKINNVAINSKSNFDEQLSYYKPGDKISVQYKRNGKVSDKQIQLTNIEGTTSVIKKEVFRAENLGAELELVPKAERARLNIENGVRIAKINRGLISRMGIEEGFIVTSINNQPIEMPEDLVSTLEKARGRVVIKGVSRQGVKGYYSFYF